MKLFWTFLAGMVMFTLGMFTEAFVLSSYFEWFIVSAFDSVPLLKFHQAIGIIALVSFLKYQAKGAIEVKALTQNEDSDKPEEKLWNLLAYLFNYITIWTFFLFGFLFKTFFL